MSQQRWAMADKGHFEILVMQCEKCIYKLKILQIPNNAFYNLS